MAFDEDVSVFDSAKRSLGPWEALKLTVQSNHNSSPALAHAALALDAMAQTGLNLRRYSETEAAAGALIDLAFSPYQRPPFALDDQWGRVLLAQAQISQGRSDEGLKTIEPVLVRCRAKQVQGAGSLLFRQQFARALYVQALGQPATQVGTEQRRDSLNQAAKVLNELPEDARRLRDIKELLSWIGAELQKPGGEAPRP